VRIYVAVLYFIIYVYCCISVWRSVVLPNGLCGTASMFARMHWSMDISLLFSVEYSVFYLLKHLLILEFHLVIGLFFECAVAE